MNRRLSHLIAAACMFTCTASLSADVVTEYQWTSGGSDWFAEPSQAPFSGLPAEVSLDRYTDVTNNSGIRNYASNTLIGNGITADGGFPVAINGFLGPGLTFVVQNSGEDFGAAGTNFRLRQQRGRFNVRNRDLSSGMTMFGWSSSAPTKLADLDFALAIGPAGQAPPLYQEGLRLVIQDTSDQWYLSNWSSNGKTPVGGEAPVTGTATGVHLVDLDTETWAAYAPASLSSNSLACSTPVRRLFQVLVGASRRSAFSHSMMVAIQLFGSMGFESFRIRLSFRNLVRHSQFVSAASSLLGLEDVVASQTQIPGSSTEETTVSVIKSHLQRLIPRIHQMHKQIMMGHILAVTLLVSCCPSMLPRRPL